MCLLFGCMADDFWLCKVQNEVGTLTITTFVFRRMQALKRKDNFWNCTNLRGKHEISLISFRHYILCLMFWYYSENKYFRPASTTAHGHHSGMNGKYQQPNYYAESKSQCKTYSVNQYIVFKGDTVLVGKWCKQEWVSF